MIQKYCGLDVTESDVREEEEGGIRLLDLELVWEVGKWGNQERVWLRE